MKGYQKSITLIKTGRLNKTTTQILTNSSGVAMMGHWGTCPLEFANARKFCSRSNYGCAYLSAEFSQLEDRPSKSPVTVAGCCKETSAIFVFADLTPDGFYFWMTL